MLLEGLFSAQFVITTLHFAPSAILFYRRRKFFPISGRSVPLVLTAMIALFVYNLALSVAGALSSNTTYHCFVPIVTEILPIYVFANGYFARAWRTWFFYLAACEKATRTTISEPQQSRWFADKRRFVTTLNLMLIVLGCSTLQYSASVIAFVVQIPNYTAEELAGASGECDISYHSYNIFAIFAAILCAFGIWTVRKLRSIQDGFMILKELKYVGIAGLVGLVAVFLLANVFLLWIPAYILAWAFSQGLFFMSLTYPVWKSYRYERDAKGVEFTKLKSQTETVASRASTLSLQEVLDKRDSRDLFTEHLKKEWSVENILFYQAVCEYEDRCAANMWPSSDARNQRALEMFFEYISENSDLQVNIAAGTSKPIRTKFEKCFKNFPPRPRGDERLAVPKDVECVDDVPHDVFAQARTEIFRLMESDSFVRFRREIVRMASASELRPRSCTTTSHIV